MISVIVPVYQAQQYLTKMLDSILSQTYTDWELILVVSNSMDDSFKICESYARKDARIRVFSGDNMSAAAARNKGLEKARAEYISFVDADDFLPTETVLEALFKKAVQTKADITVANYERLWDGHFLPAQSHRCFSSKDTQSEDFRFQGFFSVGTLSYVWGKLYRKQFLNKNHLRFAKVEYSEDKLFNIQCYLDGARYAFVEAIGYVYRKNERSVSYRYNPHLKECWLEIASAIKRQVQNKKTGSNEKNAAQGLIEYLLFFGIFFSMKMEYTEGHRSIAEVQTLIRDYQSNPLAKRAFRKLVSDRRINQLSQMNWKVMIRLFSVAVNCRMYWAIAVGIRLLVALRVDERLSDTGLRR